ncbi:HET domain-containing protein [Apiospora saccharicola]
MRLLDARKIELVEFIEESAPVYAILSHRWEDDEVALQEIQELNRRQWSKAFSQTANAIRAKQGYVKLKRFAELALQHGYNYVWVDTCCIDKTSSAELSEAINSMYRWYQNAAVCYAYLSDVKYGYQDAAGSAFHRLCSKSLWFSRGWTLQELVAPSSVMFYGADWKYLGSKDDEAGIRAALRDITGINIRVLDGSMRISDVSIAERMKWASKRRTSRPEDMAYSLLGLFDVNMPLLYGEGGVKAFIRLQEEILRSSNDHTIFAWRLPSAEAQESKEFHGLLASNPDCFHGVKAYRPLPPAMSQMSTTWTTTNQGMHLSILLQPDVIGTSKDDYLAVLECSRRGGGDSHWSPGVHVRRLYGDQFARVRISAIEDVPTGRQANAGKYETCFFKQNPILPIPDFLVSFDNLDHDNWKNPLARVVQVHPPTSWDSESGTVRVGLAKDHRFAGIIRFHSMLCGYIDLAFGLKRYRGGVWTPWQLQQLASENDPLERRYQYLESFIALHDHENISFQWQRPGEEQTMQIQIQERTLHGRVYFLIKAWALSERSETNIQSPLQLYDDRIGRALAVPLPLELHHLLRPFIAHDSLDRGYLNTSLTMQKAVRIAQGHSMARILSQHLTETPINSDLANRRIVAAEKLVGHSDQETKFLRHCAQGNQRLILELLIGNAALKDSVSTSPFDLGAIHWAAAGGHTGIIGELLRRGVDYNALTPQGWTPMHIAALFGRFRALNWIVRCDSRKFASDILNDRSSELKESPLHLAMTQVLTTEDDEELDALVKLIDQVEDSSVLWQENSAQETPMHRLAASGLGKPAREKGLGKILTHEKRHQFPGRFVDHLGRTLLWHATCSGRTEEVRLLLETTLEEESAAMLGGNIGSLVNKGDYYGIYPLHVACRLGHAKVARALLNGGAWPNCVTSEPGFTPAHYAALFNHPKCLEVLIECGADVDLATKSVDLVCKTHRHRPCQQLHGS